MARRKKYILSRDDSAKNRSSSYEPQASGLIPVTRRTLLVSTGALAASYSVGFAQTSPLRWRVERDGDEQINGREQLRITCSPDTPSETNSPDNPTKTKPFHGRLMREVAFGEYVRAAVFPLAHIFPNKPTNFLEPVDQLLKFDGLELARAGAKPERFSLGFHLRHNGGAPAVYIWASGWIFGNETRLCADISANCFAPRNDSPTMELFKLDSLSAGDVRNFIAAIFGARLKLSTSPKPSLFLQLPNNGLPAKWIVRSDAETFSIAVSTHPADKPPAALLSSSTLVAASELAVWRQLGAKRKADAAKADDELVKADLKDVATIAELRAADNSRRGDTVLAEYDLGKSRTASIVVSDLVVDYTADPNQTATGPVVLAGLTRRDGSTLGAKSKSPIIETVVKVASASVEVRTSQPGKEVRVEGPFCLKSPTPSSGNSQNGSPKLSPSQITIMGPPVGSAANLSASLYIDDAVARNVETAFGPLEIRSPERKPLRRTSKLSSAGDSAGTGKTEDNKSVLSDVQIEAQDWQVTKFEARADLLVAGVALSPEMGDSSDEASDYRTDLKFGLSEVRTDLLFRPAEVLFRLQGLGAINQATNRSSLISLGWMPDAPAPNSGFGPAFSVSLDNATLLLSRWKNLVSLKYRFKDADLVVEGDAKVGHAFFLKAVGETRQSADAWARRGAEETDGSSSANPGPPTTKDIHFDPRPMMVVEFPPQHVAEEAFFIQRKTRPQPPEYPITELNDADARSAYGKFKDLRGSYRTDQAKVRAETRIALIKLLNNYGERDKVKLYSAFANNYTAKAQDLPAEQRIYVGPEFLDPAARLVAELVVDSDPSGAPAAASDATLFDYLTDDPVNDDEMKDITLGIEKALGRASAQDMKIADIATNTANNRRNARDPFFLKFKARYEDPKAPSRPPPLNDSILDKFNGRTSLQISVNALRKQRQPGELKAFDANARQFNDYLQGVSDDVLKELGLSGVEDPKQASRAYLSGPSRLAFRLNTDDYDPRYPSGVIPFSASNLTSWSRHELAVVRRAEKLFKTYEDGSPRPEWDRQESEDLADMLLHQGLTRGGFDPGSGDSDDSKNPKNWSSNPVSAAQRLSEVAAAARQPPGDLETAIELPYRLMLSPAQDGRFRTRRPVVPWIFKRPGKDALPSQSAFDIVEPLWTAEFEVTANSALRAIWSPDFRPDAFSKDSAGAPSDDTGYALSGTRLLNRPPLRGPYKPWVIGADQIDPPKGESIKFRTSLDSFDRHELVALSSVHGLPVIGRVKDDGTRIGVDQRKPPEGFQVATGGWPTFVGKPDLIKQRETLASYNDVYVPKRLETENLELMLSSLGGFLNVNATFDPPASLVDGNGDSVFPALSIERWRHRIVLGRDISAEVVYKGYLFPIGIRCALVKITERVFEQHPLRHGPVALLRQRMFLRVGKPDKTFPAFRQPDEGRRVPFKKLTIVTRVTPDIVDPYDDVGESGGETIQFKDKISAQLHRSGRIDLKIDGTPTNGSAFWPRVAKRNGSEVKFDFLLDDQIASRLPLVFVDNAAANDQRAIRALCVYYNHQSYPDGDVAAGEVRNKLVAGSASNLVSADMRGAKLTFAPQSRSGDTQYETQSLVFAADGQSNPSKPVSVDGQYNPFDRNDVFKSDPFLQGQDQPSFFPAMRFARIKVAQIDKFTGGKTPPIFVGYDPTYALHGFDPPNVDAATAIVNPQDVFLSVLTNGVSQADGTPDPNDARLDFQSSGDRGGAVGRPHITVRALSRKLGPVGLGEALTSAPITPDTPPAVAGTYKDTRAKPPAAAAAGPAAGLAPPAPPAATPAANPGAFFGEDATLLGIVKLKDVLKLLGAEIPALQEIYEFGGGIADTIDAIRQDVLKPLKTAVDDLQERLDTLAAEFAKNVKYKNYAIDLKKVYPDVYATIGGFDNALATAVGDQSGDDVSQSLQALTGVYTTGRAFVEALERTAKDPVAPLSEAVQTAVGNISSDLTKQFTDQWKAELSQLDLSRFRKSAQGFLRDAIFVPLREFIFAPPASPTLVGLMANNLENGLGAYDTALVGALHADDTWSTDILKDQAKTETFFSEPKFKAILFANPNIDAAAAQAQYDIRGLLWEYTIALSTELLKVVKLVEALPPLKVDDVLGRLKAFLDIGGDFSEFGKNFKVLLDSYKGFAAKVGCQALLSQTVIPYTKLLFWLDDKINGQISNTPLSKWAVWTDPGDDPLPLIASLGRIAFAFSDAGIQNKLDKLAQTINADATLHDLSEELRVIRAKTLGVTADGNFTDLLNSCIALLNVRISLRELVKNCSDGDFDKIKLQLAILNQLRRKILSDITNHNFVEKIDWILSFEFEDVSAWAVTTGGVPIAAKPKGNPADWNWGDYKLDGASAKAAMQAVKRDLFGLFAPIYPALIKSFKVLMAAGGENNKPNELIQSLLAQLSKAQLPYATEITKIPDWLNQGVAQLKELDGIQSSTNESIETIFSNLIDVGTADQIAQANIRMTQLVGATLKGETKLLSLYGYFESVSHDPSSVVIGIPYIYRLVEGYFAVSQRIFDSSIVQGAAYTKALRTSLQTIYVKAVGARETVQQNPPPYFNDEVKSLAYSALTAPKPSSPFAPEMWKSDALSKQLAHLQAINGNFDTSTQPETTAMDFLNFIAGWVGEADANAPVVTPGGSPVLQDGVGGRNAILVILSQLDGAVSDLLRDLVRGEIASLIDFNAVRAEVEQRLRLLIPSRITRAYDLDTAVDPFANIFLPDPGTRMTLRSRATIDLLNPGAPQVTSTGVLGPFKIHLLGDYMDIVTLSFDGARFGSDTGGKLKTNITGFEPGAAVQFLQQLSSFFSFGGNGFYLSLLYNPPGIEAGYRLPPTGFALGAMGISNLSLNAGVVLPFNDAPALFKVGLSRPEAPFLINVGVYGGGGHLALYANPAGIIGFEASFEFGAVVSFTIGPLVGQGRVTAGVFLRSFKNVNGGGTVSTVEGYVTAAGAASIAMFHVCAMLQVRVGQLADGSMAGTATFTFSFSVGLVDVEFRVTAQQHMGKGFSSTSGVVGDDGIAPPTMYADEASPILVATSDDSVWQKPPGTPCVSVATLQTNAVCKGENYAKYKSYFDARTPYILSQW
jgi:hypothetical protein